MLASVVASHAFVRSDYAIPLDAYGIWCADGYDGTVVKEDAVRAQTSAGCAVGVYGCADGSHSVDEQMIEVSCGTDEFRAVTGDFDLADYLDLQGTAAGPVAYPEKSSNDSVRRLNPSAVAVVRAGEDPRSYVGEPIPFGELFCDWDELVATAPESDEDEEDLYVGLKLVYWRMNHDGTMIYIGEGADTYLYEAVRQ